MKLSNIFLSTLAVLLCCTACSKDEESFKGKDADASLSIAVKAAGSAVTEGFHPNDENELAGEASEERELMQQAVKMHLVTDMLFVGFTVDHMFHILSLPFLIRFPRRGRPRRAWS